MIYYIGTDEDKGKILHLVYIKSWDRNALKADVLEADDYDILFTVSKFDLANWLADGLELENEMDFVFPSGDTTIIKMLFESGLS